LFVFSFTLLLRKNKLSIYLVFVIFLALLVDVAFASQGHYYIYNFILFDKADAYFWMIIYIPIMTYVWLGCSSILLYLSYRNYKSNAEAEIKWLLAKLVLTLITSLLIIVVAYFILKAMS